METPIINPINDRAIALIQLKTLDGKWVKAELRVCDNGEKNTMYAV